MDLHGGLPSAVWCHSDLFSVHGWLNPFTAPLYCSYWWADGHVISRPLSTATEEKLVHQGQQLRVKSGYWSKQTHQPELKCVNIRLLAPEQGIDMNHTRFSPCGTRGVYTIPFTLSGNNWIWVVAAGYKFMLLLTIYIFFFPCRDSHTKEKASLNTIKTLGITEEALCTVTLHYNVHCNHSKGIWKSTSGRSRGV